jgi:hypothetical protein
MENLNTENKRLNSREFKTIDTISSLLDNKFKIPFTDIRFGVDFLIGLIPTVGDILSLGISGILLIAIIRHGVSVGMLFKMIGNIVLDATVGSIPILGDIFDLGFKANRRNVAILKKYYTENPNPPSSKRSVLIVLVIFTVIMIGLIWLMWKGIAWLLGHYF